MMDHLTLFEQADSNYNGVLTFRELSDFLAGKQIPPQDIEKWFHDFDPMQKGFIELAYMEEKLKKTASTEYKNRVAAAQLTADSLLKTTSLLRQSTLNIQAMPFSFDVVKGELLKNGESVGSIKELLSHKRLEVNEYSGAILYCSEKIGQINPSLLLSRFQIIDGEVFVDGLSHGTLADLYYSDRLSLGQDRSPFDSAVQHIDHSHLFLNGRYLGTAQNLIAKGVLSLDKDTLRYNGIRVGFCPPDIFESVKAGKAEKWGHLVKEERVQLLEIGRTKGGKTFWFDRHTASVRIDKQAPISMHKFLQQDQVKILDDRKIMYGNIQIGLVDDQLPPGPYRYDAHSRFILANKQPILSAETVLSTDKLSLIGLNKGEPRVFVSRGKRDCLTLDSFIIEKFDKKMIRLDDDMVFLKGVYVGRIPAHLQYLKESENSTDMVAMLTRLEKDEAGSFSSFMLTESGHAVFNGTVVGRTSDLLADGSLGVQCENMEESIRFKNHLVAELPKGLVSTEDAGVINGSGLAFSEFHKFANSTYVSPLDCKVYRNGFCQGLISRQAESGRMSATNGVVFLDQTSVARYNAQKLDLSKKNLATMSQEEWQRGVRDGSIHLNYNLFRYSFDHSNQTVYAQDGRLGTAMEMMQDKRFTVEENAIFLDGKYFCDLRKEHRPLLNKDKNYLFPKENWNDVLRDSNRSLAAHYRYLELERSAPKAANGIDAKAPADGPVQLQEDRTVRSEAPAPVPAVPEAPKKKLVAENTANGIVRTITFRDSVFYAGDEKLGTLDELIKSGRVRAHADGRELMVDGMYACSLTGDPDQYKVEYDPSTPYLVKSLHVMGVLGRVKEEERWAEFHHIRDGAVYLGEKRLMSVEEALQAKKLEVVSSVGEIRYEKQFIGRWPSTVEPKANMKADAFLEAYHLGQFEHLGSMFQVDHEQGTYRYPKEQVATSSVREALQRGFVCTNFKKTAVLLDGFYFGPFYPCMKYDERIGIDQHGQLSTTSTERLMHFRNLASSVRRPAYYHSDLFYVNASSNKLYSEKSFPSGISVKEAASKQALSADTHAVYFENQWLASLPKHPDEHGFKTKANGSIEVTNEQTFSKFLAYSLVDWRLIRLSGASKCGDVTWNKEKQRFTLEKEEIIHNLTELCQRSRLWYDWEREHLLLDGRFLTKVEASQMSGKVNANGYLTSAKSEWFEGRELGGRDLMLLHRSNLNRLVTDKQLEIDEVLGVISYQQGHIGGISHSVKVQGKMLEVDGVQRGELEECVDLGLVRLEHQNWQSSKYFHHNKSFIIADDVAEEKKVVIWEKKSEEDAKLVQDITFNSDDAKMARSAVEAAVRAVKANYDSKKELSELARLIKLSMDKEQGYGWQVVIANSSIGCYFSCIHYMSVQFMYENSTFILFKSPIY